MDASVDQPHKIHICEVSMGKQFSFKGNPKSKAHTRSSEMISGNFRLPLPIAFLTCGILGFVPTTLGSVSCSNSITWSRGLVVYVCGWCLIAWLYCLKPKQEFRGQESNSKHLWFCQPANQLATVKGWLQNRQLPLPPVIHRQ